ncbi:unspecified product [Leishmania tarentolae]|uniref:Unspecified product n=1 Tax=Leishmania tarentolae TaxID=5689 RepID=A0A640KQN7_LEITA|nr:unspecified product [Leishmania tarentolae]
MLRVSVALRNRVAPKSLQTLAHELLETQHASGRTLMSVIGPKCYTTRGTLLMGCANLLCFATYCLMVNWIYEGYVDLWYGVYGLEDDAQDDDE